MLVALMSAASVFAAPVQQAAPDCTEFANDRVVIAAVPNEARQGTIIQLSVYSPQGPAGPKILPLTCLTHWQIMPEGAARLTAEGGVAIADDAPAGEPLVVMATAPGGPARLSTPIVGRDEIVLTGRWRQVEVTCSHGAVPQEPVGELEFYPSGNFAVTFRPFEARRDYWGTSIFDAAARRLSMTIEDGNDVPDNPLLTGSAVRDDSRLTLDGFYFGDLGRSLAPTPCRYVFEKT
ncbi:hypothetical protein IP78_13325 [Brevundimonas sp. AAP58]|uniref:hypothetical protein n=1 Tax=Brevundimonas sp. AAP58 TaxID=1523422 RepID=UPI0006B9AA5E|nr:hypothetical protein [Brevundimonas sp. AAP58]KPF75830.1 hypothetical protein IP78_13325 [Brevundimonas sp. AAP58]